MLISWSYIEKSSSVIFRTNPVISRSNSTQTYMVNQKKFPFFSQVFFFFFIVSYPYQPLPAYSCLFHLILAYSSPFQPISAYSSLFQPTSAFSSLFQPVQVYSSPFQHIPAYSSLFQHIPAYSSLFQSIPAYTSNNTGLGHLNSLVVGSEITVMSSAVRCILDSSQVY